VYATAYAEELGDGSAPLAFGDAISAPEAAASGDALASALAEASGLALASPPLEFPD
jgi:isopentenyl phosphate kinase